MLMKNMEQNVFVCFEGCLVFAIWDDRYNRLLLARDGIGIKPLYYSEYQKGLVFASELKALFKDMDVSFEIDWIGLAYYFSYNYIPELTLFLKGIKKTFSTGSIT